ncbi:hypothetical protein D3C87_1382940 [compost metagenome]
MGADEAAHGGQLGAVKQSQLPCRRVTDVEEVGRPLRIRSRDDCRAPIGRADFGIMGNQLGSIAHGQQRIALRPDDHVRRRAAQPSRCARQLQCAAGNVDVSGCGAGARQQQRSRAGLGQGAVAAHGTGIADGVGSAENDRRVIDDIAADRTRDAAGAYLQGARGYRRSSRVSVVAKEQRCAAAIDRH